jgi:hypothetical protein
LPVTEFSKARFDCRFGSLQSIEQFGLIRFQDGKSV